MLLTAEPSLQPQGIYKTAQSLKILPNIPYPIKSIVLSVIPENTVGVKFY